MSIPNIINPGPPRSDYKSKASRNIKELNVLYQNAKGFVNLKDNSNSPRLFTNKVLDFQGYIFSQKPDVIILNETWLNRNILDNELFPNNSYRVFRRDRSSESHPYDENCPKKFRVKGGGVLVAVRSDLDVNCTLHKIKGTKAKAEIISVVVTPGSGKTVCFSTLYRVGNLGLKTLRK